MDKEVVLVIVGVITLLLILAAGLLLGNEQYLRCVELVVDKSAAEIRLVCK